MYFRHVDSEGPLGLQTAGNQSLDFHHPIRWPLATCGCYVLGMWLVLIKICAFFFSPSPVNVLTDFLKKGEGREKNIYWLPLECTLTKRPNLQPGHVA